MQSQLLILCPFWITISIFLFFFNLCFVVFFLLKDYWMFLVSRNDIGSSRNKRYLLKYGLKWICKAKPKLLILCPFQITISIFLFFLLLLIESVMHVPLVSRNYIGSSRNKRYLLKDGMKLIAKAEPKLLILCPFQITISIFLLYSSYYRKSNGCSSCLQKWYRIIQK